MGITANETVDAKGLACPMPIVKTKKAISDLAPGQVVFVFRHSSDQTVAVHVAEHFVFFCNVRAQGEGLESAHVVVVFIRVCTDREDAWHFPVDLFRIGIGTGVAAYKLFRSADLVTGGIGHYGYFFLNRPDRSGPQR